LHKIKIENYFLSFQDFLGIQMGFFFIFSNPAQSQLPPHTTIFLIGNKILLKETSQCTKCAQDENRITED
jgi:hypothetical protein